MLKIIEVHPASNTQGEYIVLQNQGLVTVSLRGWALCTDAYLEGDAARMIQEMYVFRDEVAIKPYTRVVLFTGSGEDEWVPTTDGRQALLRLLESSRLPLEFRRACPPAPSAHLARRCPADCSGHSHRPLRVIAWPGG